MDEGLYPVPPDCALDTTFNPSEFQGRWYITAGGPAQPRALFLLDSSVHLNCLVLHTQCPAMGAPSRVRMLGAGLNPLFDTFDCQEHFFASPEPGGSVG